MSKLTPEEKARQFNDPPLKMIIVDVYRLKEGGIAVVGRIESGSIDTGDHIMIDGNGKSIDTSVGERFVFHPNTPSDTVHLWIKNAAIGDVEPDMIVTKQAKSISDFIQEEERRKLLEVPFRMMIELTTKVEERGIMIWGEIEYGSLIHDQTIIINDQDKVLSLTVKNFSAICGPHTEYKNMAMLWANHNEHADLKPGMIVTTEDL